jgi:hypothetical protein
MEVLNSTGSRTRCGNTSVTMLHLSTQYERIVGLSMSQMENEMGFISGSQPLFLLAVLLGSPSFPHHMYIEKNELRSLYTHEVTSKRHFSLCKIEVA